MSRALGLTMAGLTGVQVGAAMVATRPLTEALGPATIAALRYGIGLAVLAPFVLRAAPTRIAPRDLPPVLALGVAQFGLLIWLLNAGLATLPARLGAMIFATFPLLTLGLAVALGRERLRLAPGLGCGLCLAGLALSLGPGGAFGWGAAMVAAAALTGAVCAIGYRPYLARYPTLAIGWRAMTAATLALAPFAVLEGGPRAVAGLDATAWALLGFIGVASGAGYLLWLTALRHAPASQATLLLGLSPMVALALDWALLGEVPSAVVLLGLPLVLAGLVLALAPPRAVR